MSQPLWLKAFEMAERLGMTVGELGARMTCAELLKWIEYDSIHISDSWYQSALLRHTIARLAGNKKAKLEDFLPPRRKPKPRPVDVFAKFAELARAHNARIGVVDPSTK